MTPTQIYVKPVLALLKAVDLHGIVNITGGGFTDNLPRVIPNGLGARIRWGSWPVPELFQLVKNSGNIQLHEMIRTFNMGIGMVLMLSPKEIGPAQKILKNMRLSSWVIGHMISSKTKVEIIA